jgi:epoxyqueuosine reductase
MEQMSRFAAGVRDFRIRTVAVRHLKELQEEIEDRHEGGLLHDDVYDSYLAGFDYRIPDSIADPRSLIVIAYPDPPVRFSFGWHGTTRKMTVPPTYLQGDAKDAEVERILAERLAPSGYGVVQIRAPKKLLAVRGGLARYGKNNIAYVEGLGSYHRLALFCSDRPCEEDPWSEAQMLQRCEGCQACRGGCPSGAIQDDRFLLHAGRCLTLWNEKPGETEFPEWVGNSWHNCLVGCMECQRVCPENSALRDWYGEGPDFAEAETELLLSRVEPERLPSALLEKLRDTGLIEFYELMPRNLLACLRLDS